KDFKVGAFLKCFGSSLKSRQPEYRNDFLKVSVLSMGLIYSRLYIIIDYLNLRGQPSWPNLNFHIK
ncbi:hypothetical protein ABTG31_20290, partial [Acinetobacter baumannii]